MKDLMLWFISHTILLILHYFLEVYTWNVNIDVVHNALINVTAIASCLAHAKTVWSSILGRSSWLSVSVLDVLVYVSVNVAEHPWLRTNLTGELWKRYILWWALHLNGKHFSNSSKVVESVSSSIRLFIIVVSNR